MIHIQELEPLEVTFLGVLSLGLPPSRAAGDESFRVDYCTAVVEGLREAGNSGLYLDRAGVQLTPAFSVRLAQAIAALTAKGILATPPSGLPAPVGGFEAGLLIDVINPDSHPAILDRGLANECLNHILGIGPAYPFLMEQYARAGAFWRKARSEGYGN